MPAVVEVNDIDELDHYHLIWKSLLPQTRQAGFLQSLDCLQTYWRCRESRGKLRVLIVYSGGEAIGIVPLAVLPEPTGLGRIDVLTYPMHHLRGGSGVIGPEPTATLLSAFRYLRSSPRDWDMLDLRGINKGQGDHGRTQLALELAGLRAQQRLWRTSTVADLSSSWNSYWLSRKRTLRVALQRLEHRLQRSGQLTHIHYRPLGRAQADADPRWDLYEACTEIRRRCLKPEEPVSLMEEKFERALHVHAADAGALDLHVLLLGSRPAAFIYNCHWQGHVVTLRRGCDPELRRQGLSKLLRLRALRSGKLAGDRSHELGPAGHAKNRLWSTRLSRTYRYTYYPPSLSRVQLLRMSRWFADRGLQIANI